MNEPTKGPDEFAALIGIDWADQKHDVWLYDIATGQSTQRVVVQKPEALIEWLAELQAKYPGGRMAICLEQSRGPLIHALMGYAFLVLYPINPVTLARYREAFQPSRAKDDPTDARLLGELLLVHRDKLKPWKPDDEATRTLKLLCEWRRKAVDLRTRLVEQMIGVLKGYYPQALELIGKDHYSRMACDLVLKWPTIEKLQVAKPQAIRAFYYGHNSRGETLMTERLKLIEQAKPLTTDGAVVTASVMAVQMVARQILTLNESILEYDNRIGELFAKHPDAAIFESFPGAGEALAPRLLSAFGPDRTRFERAENMQAYSGIAPVVERSGKQSWTHWRWQCPKFLRQTFHEYAKNSIPLCPWAKAYYDMQVARGKSRQAAIRALAYKWIRVLFRCWKDSVPYSEERYMDSLRKRNAKLLEYLQPMVTT